MFNAAHTKGYNTEGGAQVASDSLVVTPGTVVSVNTSGFVTKSGAGDTIAGVSITDETFASDNQTVAKQKVLYKTVAEGETYNVEVKNPTSIVFDAALVASNTIDLDVNGTAMTQVTYATSNDNTLSLIATQLVTQFPTIIASAEISGTRTVAITPVRGQTVTITDVVVAAGASQANGAQKDNMIVNNYYDITASQLIDGMTRSTSTGQVKVENVLSSTLVEVSIANL